MRKRHKEITDLSVIIELLHTCHVGRLGTTGSDGYPMVKPLNFAYAAGKIYFHTAKEGEKIEDIRRDGRYASRQTCRLRSSGEVKVPAGRNICTGVSSSRAGRILSKTGMSIYSASPASCRSISRKAAMVTSRRRN